MRWKLFNVNLVSDRFVRPTLEVSVWPRRHGPLVSLTTTMSRARGNRVPVDAGKADDIAGAARDRTSRSDRRFPDRCQNLKDNRVYRVYVAASIRRSTYLNYN